VGIGLVALALSVGLWLVGLIPDSWREFLPSLFGALLLLVWGFVRFPRVRLLSRLILLLVTVSLTLIGADLTLRVLLRDRFFYRPHDMFVRVWERMPLLTRYQRSVHYEGETYGDLAAFSPDPALRELRRTEFESDAYGFRNRRRESASREPYDVVLVGDSFVAGCGTSQEDIWNELLRSRHGLRTYNLGLPGNPNQAYLNLLTQGRHLALRRGTVVLLAMFSGNDLTDIHHDIRTVEELPWCEPAMALYDGCIAFRERSSIRRLWARVSTGADPHASRLSPEQAGLMVRPFPGDRSMLFYRKYCWLLDPDEEVARVAEYGPDLERTLGCFMEFCRARELVLKVVLVPTKEEVYRWVLEGGPKWSSESEPSRVGRWLEAVCLRHQLDFLDLKPAFVRESRIRYETDGHLLWWYDDSHWNPYGHELAADLVYHQLLKPQARADSVTQSPTADP
jgi:hypothetical protein